MSLPEHDGRVPPFHCMATMATHLLLIAGVVSASPRFSSRGCFIIPVSVASCMHGITASRKHKATAHVVRLETSVPWERRAAERARRWYGQERKALHLNGQWREREVMRRRCHELWSRKRRSGGTRRSVAGRQDRTLWHASGWDPRGPCMSLTLLRALINLP